MFVLFVCLLVTTIWIRESHNACIQKMDESKPSKQDVQAVAITDMVNQWMIVKMKSHAHHQQADIYQRRYDVGYPSGCVSLFAGWAYTFHMGGHTHLSRALFLYTTFTFGYFVFSDCKETIKTHRVVAQKYNNLAYDSFHDLQFHTVSATQRDWLHRNQRAIDMEAPRCSYSVIRNAKRSVVEMRPPTFHHPLAKTVYTNKCIHWDHDGKDEARFYDKWGLW